MADRRDIKEELEELRFDADFLQKADCSEAENQKYAAAIKIGKKLPENVYRYKDSETGGLIDEFYKVYDPQLTDEEKAEYIQLKKLKYIKTIKNCVVFFTALTIISIIAAIIFYIRLGYFFGK